MLLPARLALSYVLKCITNNIISAVGVQVSVSECGSRVKCSEVQCCEVVDRLGLTYTTPALYNCCRSGAAGEFISSPRYAALHATVVAARACRVAYTALRRGAVKRDTETFTRESSAHVIWFLKFWIFFSCYYGVNFLAVLLCITGVRLNGAAGGRYQEQMTVKWKAGSGITSLDAQLD